MDKSNNQNNVKTSLARLEYIFTSPLSVLWKDIKNGRINAKLLRIFGLQLLAISIAAALGGYIATWAFERIILKEILTQEASYFWGNKTTNPQHAPPKSKNLQGYVFTDTNRSSLPKPLQNIPVRETGYFLEKNITYYIKKGPENEYLLLVLNNLYTFQGSVIIGIAPLAGALIIYFLTWLGYIGSKRALSPVFELSERLEAFNFTDQSLDEFNYDDLIDEADSETLTMLRSFDHFKSQISELIERERLFTRNASHELRTPLAVIKANLDILAYRADKVHMRELAIERIRNVSNDMQYLIETLLFLSRDDNATIEFVDVDVGNLIETVMQIEGNIYQQEDVSFEVVKHTRLILHAPEKVVSILFANIIRNAFKYTPSGKVTAVIKSRQVDIIDTGLGIEHNELKRIFEPFYRGDNNSISGGHGLGLALVYKICQRFNWKIKITSTKNHGTTFCVFF